MLFFLLLFVFENFFCLLTEVEKMEKEHSHVLPITLSSSLELYLQLCCVPLLNTHLMSVEIVFKYRGKEDKFLETSTGDLKKKFYIK